MYKKGKGLKRLGINEKYMKVFETLDDIDFEWVKKKEDINYNYNGEFSSLHFIEELDKLQ